MKEKFTISLFSQFSSNLIYLFAVYFLYLKLEVNLLGLWVFLTSVVNLGFLFIDLGINSIHYQYSGRKNISDYFGTFFMLKSILIIINFIITLILVSILQLWVNSYLFIIFLLILDRILFSFTQIFLTNLKSKMKFFKTEIPYFFITLCKTISIIYLVFNLSYFSNLLFYLSFLFFIFDFILLLIILIISKNEFRINKPRKALLFEYLKDIRPLFFFSIISVIAVNIGNLIIYYTFGDKPLGYISLVNTFIIPILLSISESLITVYLSLFSKYFEKDDLNSIKKIIYIIEKYSAILFLSVLIIVLLNSELIITIFLPKYKNSVPILYIMIFLPFFHGISLPYAYLFISGKKQKVIAYINSINKIIIIGMMILLIPTNFIFFKTLGLGNIGYALSQTIPWLLWAFLCHYYSYKYFQLKFQKKLLLYIVFGSFSFMISFFLKELLFKVYFQNKVFLLISSSLVEIGIFFGLFFAFKELNRADLNFFKQIFEFRRYKVSLKDEFLK